MKFTDIPDTRLDNWLNAVISPLLTLSPLLLIVAGSSILIFIDETELTKLYETRRLVGLLLLACGLVSFLGVATVKELAFIFFRFKSRNQNINFEFESELMVVKDKLGTIEHRLQALEMPVNAEITEPFSDGAYNEEL